MSRIMACAAAIVALVAIAAASPSPAESWAAESSAAQSTTVLWHLGFASSQPPSSSLAFRRAIASAVDRAAVARALAPMPPGGVPAPRIQHRRVAGDDRIPIAGQRFDAARALALLKESGWSGPITILAGGAVSDRTMAFEQALTQSLERTLNLAVTINRLQGIGALVQEARAGRATIFVAGWRSNPRDAGFPWIATGLAHTYFPRHEEMQALVRTRQVLALERLMLENAYIVPIVSY